MILSQTIKRTKIELAWVAALCIMLTAATGYSRKARKVHEVKAGDSIAKVADYYGVSQRDLLELNGLRKGRPLKIGQTLKIPNVLRLAGKKYKVQAGDSLASIGARFDRSPQDIAHANKMSVDAPLSVGRTIVIPDKSSAGKKLKVEKGEEPEPVMFLRVRTGEREKLQLYTKSGKLIHKSVQRLSHLARDKKTQKVKRLHFRLIYMLQQVALAFPGKAIEIISGYRPQSSGNESQHAFGRAMDFRISGVSNAALYRVCKSLKRSGCGYYPNSGFVHMDAREKKTTWVGH